MKHCMNIVFDVYSERVINRQVEVIITQITEDMLLFLACDMLKMIYQ